MPDPEPDPDPDPDLPQAIPDRLRPHSTSTPDVEVLLRTLFREATEVPEPISRAE